jgi:putative transposase
MPWQESCAMDQRAAFIGEWAMDLYSMVELSDRYGVSRKTLYKWIDRYEREGAFGFGG